MEDKDLDTYFKDRSDLFNEVPGDALWAKIEANIEPPASPKGTTRLWLISIGAVIIFGAVAAWFSLSDENKKASEPHKKQQVTTAIKDSVQHVQDTVVVNGTSFNSTAPVKAQIPSEKTVAETQLKQAIKDTTVFSTSNRPAAMAATPAGNGLPGTYKFSSAANAAKSRVKKIPYDFEIDKNKDEMVINVTQTLTRAERDKLVSSTIALNAPYVGRKIVINAKGYRLYRHTITKQDLLKYGSTADSLKLPKLKLEVSTDSLLYNIISVDSLKTETIKFEKKTEPKQ